MLTDYLVENLREASSGVLFFVQKVGELDMKQRYYMDEGEIDTRNRY